MNYDKITRLIHLFLAVFITLQLTGGQLMDVPGADKSQEAASIITPALAHESTAHATVKDDFLFDVHEYLGLFLFLVVASRWIWGLSGSGNANWRVLFPWLSQDGRKELSDDLKREPRGWIRGELPEPSDHDAIAKMVHGLMLLTVTGMVLTGLALYFGWNEHGHQTWLVDNIGEVHETLSSLLWALLGGHVFMSLWHQKLGHNVLGKMFLFKG